MLSLLDARRTAAALVAVALSAALIAFAFIVSDSYTTRMRADARLSLGGADVVVASGRPSEGDGPLDDTLIAQLSDLDGVASVRGEHWNIIYLDLPSQLEDTMKVIQGVVLKTWSESAAVMVCSNVRRGRRWSVRVDPPGLDVGDGPLFRPGGSG